MCGAGGAGDDDSDDDKDDDMDKKVKELKVRGLTLFSLSQVRYDLCGFRKSLFLNFF
jgi:hypothetical protein